MANLTTARGIILKQTDYGEANRMLTIFTDEYGIIKAAAHGAKRTKSRQSASSQFLTYAEFAFYINSGEVWNVSAAETIDGFFPIHEDIEKLSAAAYFADLTYACLDLQNPDIQLLRLLLNTLYALAYKNINTDIIKTVFELRAVSVAGFEPVTDCCVLCGETENTVAFSVYEGGAVCRGCAAPHDIPIYSGTLKMLRYVLKAEPSKIFSFKADERIAQQAAYIAEKYTAFQLDHEFDSLAYYKKIKTGAKKL